MRFCLPKVGENFIMAIGNYRAPFIDYTNKGIFMITMGKAQSAPFFSSLYRTGLQDKYKGTTVKFSPLGRIIFDFIRNFNNIYPEMRIDQFVIMPTHIHFILNIRKKLDRHLDFFIEDFKISIHREAENRGLLERNQYPFQFGYDDQFLIHSRSLHDMYVYIWENPYRLWMRWNHPEFFRRICDGNISGCPCQFYGNLELLKHPFKYSVVIHSAYTQDKIDDLDKEWHYAIKNGGVLVSAFVNKKEKVYRDTAIKEGSKIILFQNYGYRENEKPGGWKFEMCEQGKLLIVSPKFPPDIPIIGGKDHPTTKLQNRFMNSIIERL